MDKNVTGPQQIIDAGFDYLTLTIPHTHPRLFDFIQFSEQEIKRLQKEGYEERRKKVMQFEGAGNDVFFYGRYQNWDMLRVSGHEAKTVAERLRENGLTARSTRCDLQLTTASGCGDVSFADKIRATVRGDASGNQKTRRQAIATFSGANRDTGLTLGSRSSNTYIRIYDAHAKHPLRYGAGARRVETEYKGEKAKNAWNKFMEHGEQHLLSQQMNAGELTKRGIVEPWMREVIPCIPAGLAVKSTDEKTLWWLANQVVPVVKRLMTTKHGPYIRTLFLDAIGPTVQEKRHIAPPEQGNE